jgi:hypothetical protein
LIWEVEALGRLITGPFLCGSTCSAGCHFFAGQLALLLFIARFCTANSCIGVTDFLCAAWRYIFVMKLIFTTKSKKHETIKQAYFKQSNHRHTQQAKNAVHTRR